MKITINPGMEKKCANQCTAVGYPFPDGLSVISKEFSYVVVTMVDDGHIS